MDAIIQALTSLDLHPFSSHRVPAQDARFDALVKVVEKRLRTGAGDWRNDERLVLFTEYKTTLDYIQGRLKALYPEGARMRTLVGGMDDAERNSIKRAFNDPADPIRILLGTDAASEGLNLQETARFVFHFDAPFNPSRLEQ